MSLWNRIVNAFGADRLSREIDEELRLHIEEAVARGRSEEDARRTFGNLLRLRDESRDAKVLQWLDALVSDARFGWRQLRKNWVVSSAAVLSLGLSIGACTGAFRLIDAVLLRPLPVSDPGHLFYLSYDYVDQAGAVQSSDSFSYPLFREMTAAVEGDADLLAIGYSYPADLTYAGDAEMEKGFRQYVSGNTFASFGLTPTIGRLLSPTDDLKPGAHPVAVLSYDYWSSRFGRDPTVVGRTFHMGDEVYQIVGVGPKNFTGTETGSITGIFVPTMMNSDSIINDAGWNWFRIWLRPRPGQSADSLRERLQAVFTANRQERVKQWSGTPRQRVEQFLNTKLRLDSAAAGASETQKIAGRAFVFLGVLVGLVLLIACANVANLFTAQAAARSREMALRVSIGAGRLRLVQLVLVESAMLALGATVLGSLFAWWSAPWVASQVNPPDNPLRLVLPADWRVTAFTAALSVLVTFLFGLVPALQASVVKPVSALRGGDDTPSRQRLMRSLLVVQIAFCFLVQFVAGLLVTTSKRLSSQPTGFAPDRLLMLDTSTKGHRKERIETWRQIAADLRSMPGVESVALCSWPLMSGNGWSSGVRLPGQAPDEQEPYFLEIGPGFLSTLRIHLLAGRDFRPEDTPEKGKPEVAIVSESFARRYFKGQDPVGRFFERIEGKSEVIRYQIVGYMRDLRYRSFREPMHPVVFVPAGDRDWGTFAVRVSAGDPAALAPILRREVSRLRPDFRVTNAFRQQDLVDQWTIRERLLAKLSVFFAGLALILAGIGLYGVLSYSVVRRTREIGIRMALGAGAWHVTGRVTTQVLGVFAAGTLAGIAAGLASQRFVASLLFAVRATDPPMIAVPFTFLLATALVAALPAAISAVRIDPARALRAE